MPITRLFTIMFAYVDNGEVYEVDAILTDEEVQRAKNFFGKLLEKGYIRPVDETDPNEIEYIVYETPQRAPVTLAAIKEAIEKGTGLLRYGKTLGITL
jgi:hypothetical protein